jgi:hypothetical protein
MFTEKKNNRKSTESQGEKRAPGKNSKKGGESLSGYPPLLFLEEYRICALFLYHERAVLSIGDFSNNWYSCRGAQKC